MPDIKLPDGAVRHYDAPVTVADIAASIGPGLAKAAIAGSSEKGIGRRDWTRTNDPHHVKVVL